MEILYAIISCLWPVFCFLAVCVGFIGGPLLYCASQEGRKFFTLTLLGLLIIVFLAVITFKLHIYLEGILGI